MGPWILIDNRDMQRYRGVTSSRGLTLELARLVIDEIVGNMQCASAERSEADRVLRCIDAGAVTHDLLTKWLLRVQKMPSTARPGLARSGLPNIGCFMGIVDCRRALARSHADVQLGRRHQHDSVAVDHARLPWES